ncbi:bacillithiol biosynthesis cysteine-adding enzyme BshC [Olivibacter sp. SDN3]|uniref:bacillithiol biosynthesis cysteine-adding enzyme BshC n=1 Tax=Olivibacter sp. SDN3 TaxID=2764720 RepID=UPI0016518260|nr:bacillithiol biosynthesis cysteine-adding enzyme BshC [Olivibacter sp. SDN3]QNL49986.1 bacillithiol biosynthesis cysteine-adding enzyme BshC [Olivibacter sp. SDN3]
MKASYINYSDTNSFSETLIAYIANNKKLAPFIGNRPTLDGFKNQIAQKKGKTDRSLLVNNLQEQYREIDEHFSAVNTNIELLADENTFTVTTGHQLNIFTGPLYFIFKIVSTIKLCNELKKHFPEYNFVPIYWMATEDHDFEEINHTELQGETIKWDIPAQAATGRMETLSMARTVKKYKRILGLSHNSDKLATLVEKAYLSNHNTLADATRYLVNGLFGKYGLVILDGDRQQLKKTFAPYIEQDILRQNSYREIVKTTKALEKQGFEAQVHAREINFFYLTDEIRERIVATKEGKFQVLHQNKFFTEEELLKEIHEHPERFSPNVVMRPLYQEVLLPNLCYVGGGAEIVYWLQLKSNFECYKVDYPILLPRNSALISNEHLDYKIFRLNLTFKSIFRDADDLKKEYVRVHSKHRLNLNEEWLEIEEVFERIKERAGKIDPTLKPSTDAIKTRLCKAINNLERKFVKADKLNFDDAISQIDKIKEKFFPNGQLQERTENFGLLYVKYGDELISDLLRYFNPLDMKFTVLY